MTTPPSDARRPSSPPSALASPAPSTFSGPFASIRPLALFSHFGSSFETSASTPSASDSPSTRDTSTSPMGRKSGSPSTSYSPPYQNSYLALRPTLSSTTVHAAGGSYDDDHSNFGGPSSPPTLNSSVGLPLSRVETVTAETYTGGAELTRPATAPVAREGAFNSETELTSPIATTSATRDATDAGPSSSSTPSTGRALRSRRGHTLSSSGASTPSRRFTRPRSQSSAQPSAHYIPLLKPPPIRPPSAPSPTPSMQTLQSHMYTSGLLNGFMFDVHLLAFGHLYRLHRIVLSGQSGFFTSLLSGGFSEERQGAFRRDSESEIIAIEMDRPLSRAAFEFVLARLYGGGPELVPPPWAKTTAKTPLSEPWERLMLTATGKMITTPKDGSEHDFLGDSQTAATETNSEWPSVMALGTQPATPTFLLSLLATATYLEVPSVQALAMHWIQKTITPWTVSLYLGFALGKGLGRGAGSAELDAACRGLEWVGAPYEMHLRTSTMNESINSVTSSHASSVSDDADEGPTTSVDEDEEEHVEITAEPEADVSVFVGPEGERIGEACTCWLAKWGAEVLATEEWIASQTAIVAGDTDPFAEGLATPDDDASRRKIVEPFFYVGSRPKLFDSHPEFAPPSLQVWSSLGGIDARWVRGIISSDAFFLAPTVGGATTRLEGDLAPNGLESDGEFQRYLFAKRVVDLRRNEKLLQRRRGATKQATLSTMHDDDPSSSMFAGQMDLGGEDAAGEAVDVRELREAAEHLALGKGKGRPSAGSEETSSEGKCVGDGQRRTPHKTTEESYSSIIDANDANEVEFALLFRHGIHYSHMTYKQLDHVSNDFSPTTQVLYAPIEVIQRSHWQTEQFKSRLPLADSPQTGKSLETRGHLATTLSAPRNAAPGVHVPGELVTIDGPVDIGFVTPVNPNLDPNLPNIGLQPFYLVPTDDTSRINDRAPHPDSEPSLGSIGPTSPRKPNSPLPRGADGFFGLASEHRLGCRAGPHRGVLPGPTPELGSQWVEYAPLRVSAEFWGVTALRDKARLYSHTFFYAGSFYNLYLQRLRLQKKGGHQLGIYLHRQNSIEQFPAPSAPPTHFVNSSPYKEMNETRIANMSSGVLAPYTDKRKQIRAFFSIHVANQLGTSMTKFSSGPDSFALSQSWGWKSASLSSEYLGTTPIEASYAETARAGPYSSLRVTILMSVV